MYLWFFLERLQEEVLLDEHLGLGHGDHRRLVAAERRQADVQVKAQGRLGADPWIHLPVTNPLRCLRVRRSTRLICRALLDVEERRPRREE
jgi:hypothetical protein